MYSASFNAEISISGAASLHNFSSDCEQKNNAT
jgi:hypothetical protein